MIPPIFGDATSSPGEKVLFRRFRDEQGTDGWVVFHSLDIPAHRRQIAGEIDFVVAVPNFGVLCLEVKSHRKVRRDPAGMWYLGQDPPNRTGPFRQASESMHSLREYVADRSEMLGGVMFWSAVCFTHIPFPLRSPAEWHDWQVIDSTELRVHTLSHIVQAVLTNARTLVASKPSGGWLKPGEPTAAQIDKLVDVLRPSFEFFESPKSRRRQRDDELLRYTADQYFALDAMNPSVNPRVIFQGAAGTGKTLLALEETRRAVARGERVLLCCFNALLGSWLKSEAAPLRNATVATTFHSYARQVSGLSSPPGASSTFWEGDLPRAAAEKLLAEPNAPFDLLVVDEAQDLFQAAYLDVMDLSVEGGLARGRWRMFGDFEQQSIYGSASLSVDDVLHRYAPGTPRFMLTKNCRNTPRIASLVKLLAAFDRGYADVLRPDNGIEPETIYYTSSEDQRRRLVGVLNMLKSDGYGNNEIVILSTRANSSAAQDLKNAPSPYRDRLQRAADEVSGSIRYCTVHAFKGLEAPVVVVTDITSIDSDADRSLFYVALTRATERLYVLASAQLQPVVLKLLLKQASQGAPND